MNRVSKLSLFLMLVAMIAVYVPSAFAQAVSNPTCEPGYHDVGTPEVPDCVLDEVTECPPICLPPTCIMGVLSIACPPPKAPVETTPAPAPPAPDDGKGISFNDSDLGVSLYVNEDENGAPVLEIYETQNQTDTGNFAVTVTQDDLAQYVENLPAENVLLKAQGHIRVYILTTGEISVFVGPDSEGKVHVKVFNGIPWTNVYGFTIDPV